MAQDRQRWSKVVELFESAAEIPVAEQHAWVQDRCGGDVGLFAEVRSLLDASQAEKAASRLAVMSADAMPSQRFGVWQAIRPLGTGGMGSVLLVRRADGQFDQLGALKMIAPHLVGPYFIERFLAERQILASLNHSNITKLLDGGISADPASGAGIPYLVMEYVDGVAVDKYADQQMLTTRQRLELFLQICDAVEFAHTQQIVHRDLKPSNILIETATGQPKHLDFGTARILPSAAEQSEATITMHRMVTPRYASPEALRHAPVTPQADVFSLGVLLYEQLTGCWPFGAVTTPAEVAMRITGGSIAPPESRITEALAEARSTNPRELRLELRGDLSAILHKALQHDLKSRYQTVAELAADIRNVLAGRSLSPGTRPAWKVKAAVSGGLAMLLGLAAVFWLVNHKPRIESILAGEFAEPSVSYDGQWLAYTAGPHVWVRRLRDGQGIQVTSMEGRDRWPAIAPDGTMVVYEHRGGTQPGLYRLRLQEGKPDGQEERIGQGFKPHFSPDGKKVAFDRLSYSGADTTGESQAVDMIEEVTASPPPAQVPVQLPTQTSAKPKWVWQNDSSAILVSAVLSTRSPEQWFHAAGTRAGSLKVAGRTWPGLEASDVSCGMSSAGDFVYLSPAKAIISSVSLSQMRVPSSFPLGDGGDSGVCQTLAGDAVAVSFPKPKTTLWEMRGQVNEAHFEQPARRLQLESRQPPSFSLDGRSAVGIEGLSPKPPTMVATTPGSPPFSTDASDVIRAFVSPDAKVILAVRGAVHQLYSIPGGKLLSAVKLDATVWDISSGARWWLSTTRDPSSRRPIGVYDSQAQTVRAILVDPERNLYLAAFSPNEQWVAFTAERDTGPPIIYVAPFDPQRATPQDQWIEIGPGDYPEWSPAGNRLYFLSANSESIETVELNPGNMRPGPVAPQTIYRFNQGDSPRDLSPGTFRISVAPARILFNAARRETEVKLLRGLR